MNPSYNANFGMQPQAPGVSSGGGDIVLAPSKGDNSKLKKVLIGGVIAIVVLVIVIVILAVISGNKGSSNNAALTARERYVNYIVNGDVNNHKYVAEGYATNVIYKITDEFYNGNLDEWGKYWEGAKGLINELVTTVGTETMTERLGEHAVMLEMFDIHRTIETYGMSGLMESVLTGGYEVFASGILNRINGLNKETNGYVNQYVEEMSKAVSLVGEMMGYILQDGCDAMTLEELSQCEVSEEAYGKYLDKNSEAYNAMQTAETVIAAAVPYYVEIVYGVVNE